ncbi:hypothetical protein Oweho_2512 [Owenweeksia hongkongensis DSM 17368]|uniref:Uncharacterized protein n=1 Tax=Owenweeksia hongkongensis (strain DSM 17368 / CIP 108786 / JCM 12287 / NRRL B-23963 / UST20020801) TaxID=926562 RepID=G8R7V1_OWEHD|nr:hypothetical protein [Owenweeksia hongkongensis]AEV33482.1 hypothetical protein Oweho_2512 [Owenweeksia hongkongensis DSM 17368]
MKKPKENPSRTWLDTLGFIFLGDTFGLSYNFSFALGIVLLFLGLTLAVLSALNLNFIKATSGVLLILVGVLTCRKALNKRRKQQ